MTGWYLSWRAKATVAHYFVNDRSLCVKYIGPRTSNINKLKKLKKCGICAKRAALAGIDGEYLSPVQVDKMSRMELAKLRDIKYVEDPEHWSMGWNN